MGTYEDVRRLYADLVTHVVGVDDARIHTAFRTIPREKFLGEGPWTLAAWPEPVQTPSADPIHVYHDRPVAIANERGINNGQPSLHARALQAAKLIPGETVLHVGAGAGYYSAILGHLTGSTGKVLALEVEADLAGCAHENLKDWPQVRVENRSGTAPPLPQSDVIYVCAGATHPPAVWLDALKPGGRLIFPLTPDKGLGCMLLITRTGEGYSAAALGPAMFIPCIGGQDEAAGERLRAVFPAPDYTAIKSLHRHTPPDETCWLEGEGWWLSTAQSEAED